MITANDIPIGAFFKVSTSNRIFKRVLFEDQEIVIYRCIPNVAAIESNGNITFFPAAAVVTLTEEE